MHPFECPDIRIDESYGFCSQGDGDAKAKEHILALARFLDIEPGPVQLVVDVAEAGSIVPLNQVVSDSVLLKKIPQHECLFFGSLVQAENDLRNICGSLQLSQDILKHGKIISIRVLAGEEWNNQYRLLPPGMEPELGSQMLSILLEYVECGKLDAILGEIRNSLTSTFSLSGLETKENPVNCQLSLTIINNSIPLVASGVIRMG